MRSVATALLLLAAAGGMSSCSLFGGDGKKKHKPADLSRPTLLPADSPLLGSDGPNLGG
ncbi:hypothetical protein OKA04_15315 [Luteolibacter flavescens]|uniref:Lipoprotein n=1 Tax=Luteolibacter flavescens TaxID=1859460 RepID=A0ABT3FRA0_9BACT|nr:hypothetical protein [Luteolibacter flavescens]MCW1886107.1 hypothetical protein [Luteolibacter flavescens]